MKLSVRVLIAMQQAIWPFLPRSWQCWINRVPGGWLVKRNLRRAANAGARPGA